MSLGSGVTVDEKCINAFERLKARQTKWFVCHLEDDPKVKWKWTVGDNDEHSRKDDTDKTEEQIFDQFAPNLLNAKDKNEEKGLEEIAGRCAVYDFEYEAGSGEGKRSRIMFIGWTPDDAKPKMKMLYSSSREALKRAFNGIAVDVQANNPDDLEYLTVQGKAIKGR